MSPRSPSSKNQLALAGSTDVSAPHGVAGSVLLDPIRDVAIEGHSQPYWIVNGRAGHSLSLYPVVLPLLIDRNVPGAPGAGLPD